MEHMRNLAVAAVVCILAATILLEIISILFAIAAGIYVSLLLMGLASLIMLLVVRSDKQVDKANKP